MKTDEVILRVLPQFFPKHRLDSPGMVFTDFPSRVRIGYVLRATSDYSYIMENDLAALRLSVEELHAAALGNLERLPSASISIGKVPGGAEGWLSATDDNFAAVRILLPAVQEQFSQVLGAEFLLTIPHRDDCFCWSLTQSQDRQAKHARDALNDFCTTNTISRRTFYFVGRENFSSTLSRMSNRVAGPETYFRTGPRHSAFGPPPFPPITN